VAFNEAAAYFRLSRYDDAVAHYRRALDDDALPEARRARAWFDLGNAQLAKAGGDNRRLLEAAIQSYRQCMASNPAAGLRRDVQHNLEIAGERWLKSRPAGNGADTEDPSPDGSDKEGASADGKRNKTPQTGARDVAGPNKEGTGQDGGDNTKSGKQASRGPITVLADQSTPQGLSQEEALAHLERALDRLRQERRSDRDGTDGPLRGKDW
jgi:tetratricopeptide (TPR) repeat protein